MLKNRYVLNMLKYSLTLIGGRLPHQTLQNLQALVNYLRIGRWMSDHNFKFPQQAECREEVWSAVTRRIANKPVLYLEFGVAKGASMKFWSHELKHPKSVLHGFDSFEGLPESGGPWTKGRFDARGAIPKIEDDRVTFFKGWFDTMLPKYSIPPHETLVINLDADLYSSTIFVLRYLRAHIKPGSLIYFDEMNQIEHEPRAFDEFMAESGKKFRPIKADKTLAYCFFECVN